MNVGIYARVSTTDQNAEMQVREMREYALRRGWSVQAEYIDTGWSGAKASRPELDRMMADAGMHRFDAVMVWKLDRFGRSVRNCLQGIETLRSNGVRFLAVSQSIDTDESNPTSRLMLHVLAAVAEFEREMIRERVSAGVRNAKSKGKQVGRQRAVFDKDRARSMHQDGLSVRDIALELNVGRGTMHRFLSQKPILSAVV